MNSWDGADGHSVLLIDDFIHALVVKFVDGDLTRDRRNLVFTRLLVPVVGLEKMVDGISRAHVLRLPAGPPDLERHWAPRGPTAGPQGIQITPVVRVQVAEKDFGEVLIGDHERCDIAHRPRADVEDEFIAVAQFEQKTSRSLRQTLIRHTRAAGDNANLVLGQHFSSRVVDIAIRCFRIRAGHYPTRAPS